MQSIIFENKLILVPLIIENWKNFFNSGCIYFHLRLHLLYDTSHICNPKTQWIITKTSQYQNILILLLHGIACFSSFSLISQLDSWRDLMALVDADIGWLSFLPNSRCVQDFQPGSRLDQQLVCTTFTPWQAITDMVPYEMIQARGSAHNNWELPLEIAE